MTEYSPYSSPRPSLPTISVRIRLRKRREPRDSSSAFELPHLDSQSSALVLKETPSSESEGRYSPLIEYPPAFSPCYITRPLKCLRSRRTPEKNSPTARLENELRKRAALRTKRGESPKKQGAFIDITRLLSLHRQVDRQLLYREVKEPERSPKRLPPLGLLRRRSPSPPREPRSLETVRCASVSRRPNLSLLIEAFSYPGK